MDSGVLKEATRRNVAYFAVALKLSQTPIEGYDEKKIKKYPWDKKEFKPLKKVDFAVPNYVAKEVNEEIKNIGRTQELPPKRYFRPL